MIPPVRYCSSDLELVLTSIMLLEQRIENMKKKTGMLVEVETNFSYSMVDGFWEGELKVIKCKKK